MVLKQRADSDARQQLEDNLQQLREREEHLQAALGKAQEVAKRAERRPQGLPGGDSRTSRRRRRRPRTSTGKTGQSVNQCRPINAHPLAEAAAREDDICKLE